jgi:hypothetical protein
VCGVSGEVRAALGKIRARKRRGPTLDTGVGLARRWRRQPAGGVRGPALRAMEYHAASGHHPSPPDWKRVRSVRKRRRGSTTRRLSQIPKPLAFTSISSCQQVAAPRRPAYQPIEFVKSGLIMCWSATRRCWTISRWRDLSRDGNPMLPLMDSSHWRVEIIVRSATTGIPRSVRRDFRYLSFSTFGCSRWPFKFLCR